MSEPDDKPSPPKTPSAASRPASPSTLDEDWDALLGAPSSSGSERPIFAPPGAKPRVVAVPEPTPRTSQAGASVSGEFEVPERPEPAIPSRRRNEPASAAREDLTATARLQIVPSSDTLDDEDVDPASAAEPTEEVESEPLPASVEPERGGGSRGLVFIVGGLATIAAIALLIYSARDRDDREPVTTRVEEPANTTGAREPGTKPEPDLGETTTSSEGTETGTGGETGDEPPPPPDQPKHVNPRDPSLIPAGTPEDNAKAFLKLPVSIHDGPPLGGIGRSGLHIDEISTARGRDNTDCRNPTQRFSISADEYVNVCIRVVHPRELEWLRVIWEKDGKVTRRGRVRVPELHAYTTRAYLLLRPEYVGQWRVRIVPEGEEDIELAVAEFSITE